MSKEKLIEFVKERAAEAETYYVNNGPRKHDQEDHYTLGVAVVGMNVELLDDWLSDEEEYYEIWEGLSLQERREVWEASGFHFGIYGYEERDADFYFHVS